MTFSGNSSLCSISSSFSSREVLLGVVVERLEDLVEDLGVESSHEGPLLDGHED